MKWKRYLLLLLAVFVFSHGVYGVTKPLPENISYSSEVYPIADEDITLLVDHTFVDENGEQVFEHEIFSTILEMVNQADEYILLDMFLFNNQLGQAASSYRQPSSELSNQLALKARATESIYVITDHINTAYGSYYPEPLQTILDADIPLIFTDTTHLRDSNPLYSSFYRSLFRHIPKLGGNWLPNPFDPNHEKATLPAYLQGLNFKANHRKVLVTDSQEAETGNRSWHAIVTSLNPHDGSSMHSNIAIKINNHLIITDIIKTEESVANFSSNLTIQPDRLPRFELPSASNTYIQLLTEGAIKQNILHRIADLNTGDKLDMAMFYFSDRDIIKAIKHADERGVQIRIILDPNQDAFGREKNGIPNRQVAHELTKHSVGNTTIRWCATQGEQCHSKFLITSTESNTELLLGSANFTRRNLDNLNLETNIRIIGDNNTPSVIAAQTFFDQQWGNTDGRIYTVDYSQFADSHIGRTIWYRFGEFTGISHY